MFRVIDESQNVDMTAKYELGQEVVVVGFQGYRKGVITGITANCNSKGTIFLYTVEFYVGKKSTPKVKKCLEKHLFDNIKDALAALAEKAAEETKKPIEE